MINLNGKKYVCPVDVTLGLIGGKWKLLILSYLHWNGAKSYSEIRSNLIDVSEKMLSQQLKQLESDKLIEKNIISEKPYRVEYFLTIEGKSLSSVYDTISQWGINYLEKNGINYLKDQNLYK